MFFHCAVRDMQHRRPIWYLDAIQKMTERLGRASDVAFFFTQHKHPPSNFHPVLLTRLSTTGLLRIVRYHALCTLK